MNEPFVRQDPIFLGVLCAPDPGLLNDAAGFDQFVVSAWNLGRTASIATNLYVVGDGQVLGPWASLSG